MCIAFSPLDYPEALWAVRSSKPLRHFRKRLEASTGFQVKDGWIVSKTLIVPGSSVGWHSRLMACSLLGHVTSCGGNTLRCLYGRRGL